MKRKKRHGFLRPLTILILIGVFLLGGRLGMERLFPTPYEKAILSASTEYNLSPALLYSLIKAESNFDAEAISVKGAKGLMQLMDETAQWCGKKAGLSAGNLLNPEENIALGAYYIGYLLSLYQGEETCALAAYNAGQGRVNSWLRDSRYSADGKTLHTIPFLETEKYVKKIRLYKKIYERKLA